MLIVVGQKMAEGTKSVCSQHSMNEFWIMTYDLQAMCRNVF